MEDDGIIYIRPNKDPQCEPGKHELVPLIEGERTVGLHCTKCPFNVREEMKPSGLFVYEDGSMRAPLSPNHFLTIPPRGEE